MRVRMQLLGINAVGMLMLMMFVVAMDMIMVERSVRMMITVAFGQVRPDAAPRLLITRKIIIRFLIHETLMCHFWL